ncbi:hypothetical protein AB0M86_46390 [Streptomyces sp. NPDC051639]|uniref:hypothetical protein n=1 Tax=unclassified Streptomyces TaxID=2593676 RepID=UPI0033A755A8
MTGDEGLGVLKRLTGHRQLDIGALAQLTGVTERELLTLFHGGTPNPSLIRRLAPVLGLRTADLFAVVGVDVSDDLAPTDTTAGSLVPRLVRHAVALPPEQKDALRGFVTSLPQEERTKPVPGPPVHEQYSPGPGALLMRMARNRNLNWLATAMTFQALTGRYWSAATYGGVGHGRNQLTPELLLDFSTVLGVAVGDLAAMTGIEPPDSSPRPAAAGVAELIWDVRRLTASQLQQVSDLAESAIPHTRPRPAP